MSYETLGNLVVAQRVGMRLEDFTIDGCLRAERRQELLDLGMELNRRITLALHGPQCGGMPEALAPAEKQPLLGVPTDMTERGA